MTLSNHAQKRMQQRGLTADLIFLLESLGVETRQSGNTYLLELDKKTQKTLCKKLKSLLMQVQRNAYVVLTEDDVAITAAHAYKKH